VSWYLCQCDQAIRESLNPFRYWLRQYFSISTYQNEARNKRNFNRRLDRLIAALVDEKLAAELDRTRSFLGAQLDLYWNDSLYEQLDPQGRYENTLIGLISLILAESTLQPIILQLEDVQWLDDDSWTLLTQLERMINSDQNKTFPLAIIATARPEFLTSGLRDGLPFQELHLNELTLKSLNILADQLLDGSPSAELLNLLSERTQGNPFFTEQTIQFLQDEAMLHRKSGEWTIADLTQSPLPDNIRALLVSRLDRLTEDVKQVVLTAAVLGREFEVQILSYMLDGDASLRDKISHAEQNAIWSKINELRYLFNNALQLDAAYRMQVRSHRQILHELAVKAIETTYSQDLSPYSSDLAYHCEKAGLVDKARFNLVESAAAAKNKYQNSQAVEYLNRALHLTSEEDLDTILDLVLERETLLSILGVHEKRLQDLEYLNHLLENSQGELPESDLAKYRSVMSARWASFKIDDGNFRGAVDSIQEILALADQYQLTENVFDAYYFWSQIHFRRGDFTAAKDKALEGLAQAHEIHDLEGESRVLNLLGLIAS
jgi:hypothetical protein